MCIPPYVVASSHVVRHSCILLCPPSLSCLVWDRWFLLVPTVRNTASHGKHHRSSRCLKLPDIPPLPHSDVVFAPCCSCSCFHTCSLLFCCFVPVFSSSCCSPIMTSFLATLIPRWLLEDGSRSAFMIKSSRELVPPTVVGPPLSLSLPHLLLPWPLLWPYFLQCFTSRCPSVSMLFMSHCSVMSLLSSCCSSIMLFPYYVYISSVAVKDHGSSSPFLAVDVTLPFLPVLLHSSDFIAGSSALVVPPPSLLLSFMVESIVSLI
jgi:hypothetical protein